MLRVKVFNPTDINLPEKATPKSSAKDIRANLELVSEKYCFNAVIGYVHKSTKTGILHSDIRTHSDQNDAEDLVPALIIQPQGRALVPSGLMMELPANYHMDVRPRSGLALKYGIEVVNAPGLIDEDYRGDVGIIVKNGTVTDNIIIVDGERIAQIQLAVDYEFAWDNVDSIDELSQTVRADGGFNSSGTK